MYHINMVIFENDFTDFVLIIDMVHFQFFLGGF